MTRIIVHRHLIKLVIGLVLVAAGACTAEKASPPTSAAAQASATPSAGLDPVALRRPWAQATISPGASCPVTVIVSQPDPGLGPMLGDGPARAVGLGRDAVLAYRPGEGSGWKDKTWGGQKILWAVDPSVTGPVLVRGRQLDGDGQLGFEDDPVIAELVLNTGSYEGRSGGWKDAPSYTRVRTPGCYAYQIDTAQGSWTIVFLARDGT